MTGIEDTKDNRKPKAIVIAGPTASGKTAFAVELALSLSGEIVNADSMQVYRGMDVGTAKPTSEEKKGIPHHLMDIVDPDEEFNAAIYRATALASVMDICSRGKICLVVGGTGLYIRALLGGLMKSPQSEPGLREWLRSECEIHGAAALYKRLSHQDPEHARNIHPNDKVRVMRALEIIYQTRQRSSDLMKEHRFRDRPLNSLKLFLKAEREQLYHRINERSAAMVQMGLVEETQALIKKGYSPNLKPMKAIGYRHAVRYLEGIWTLEYMKDKLKRDTRRYAKRQMTWFRADPEAIWIDRDDFGPALKKIKTFLSETT